MAERVVIVDTNVGVVANGAGGNASQDCVTACRKPLFAIMNDEMRLAIDGDRLIIREYMGNLRSAGQPGVGDRFLKWVLTNQANPHRCEQVPIRGHGARGFEEFPDHPDLISFDRGDRKFVAVAVAHPSKPPVLEAVDSDWWGAREALATAGITVRFLCEAEVRATWEGKHRDPRGRHRS